MLKEMTRSRLIQIWFSAVVLIVVAGLALGVNVTGGTWTLLAGLCLVPPAMVLMLWPGVQPPTAADVLHGIDRRR